MSLFIVRHPLVIILITFYVLYQLMPYKVEDNDDILKVLVSSLLLKSDDPHQKPQHFPELPNSPQPNVGEQRTRVLLLAYARFFTIFPFSHFHVDPFQIRFFLCWWTSHSWSNLLLLLWAPVCAQTKVCKYLQQSIKWESRSQRNDLRGICQIKIRGSAGLEVFGQPVVLPGDHNKVILIIISMAPACISTSLVAQILPFQFYHHHHGVMVGFWVISLIMLLAPSGALVFIMCYYILARWYSFVG